MKTPRLAHGNKVAASAQRSTRGNSHLRERSADRGARRPTAIYASLCAIFLLSWLSACSDDSNKPAEHAKPEVKGPELITARSAFQKLYVAARGWNPDAKPYRIESSTTSDSNGQDGKWAIWRASFASAASHTTKPYIWSGSAA